MADKLCVLCHYARMREDICGIYCTGGFVEQDGTCRHFAPAEEGGHEKFLCQEDPAAEDADEERRAACSDPTYTENNLLCCRHYPE